jgi:uncharacterized YccA/Bax inhibitor family protein
LTIGRAFGVVGIVLAIVVSLAVGSWFSMIMNCRAANVALWVTKADLIGFICGDLLRLVSWGARAHES